MTDYEEIVKTRMADIGANNGKPGSTAACLQVESEMVWLAPFIDRLKPKMILEIGIYKAGWPYVLAPFFAEGAYIIGVDAMLRHNWGQADGREDLIDTMALLRGCGFRVAAIEGRSDDPNIYAAVYGRLTASADTPALTLLHIDGAHDYKSAKGDWDTYAPLIGSGGLVVLHDIGTQTSQMDVKRLWEEIKALGFKSHEFYEKNGIGVVEIQGERPEQEVAILDERNISKNEAIRVAEQVDEKSDSPWEGED